MRIVCQNTHTFNEILTDAGAIASDSDEPYLQPSNRGNKLKRKAQHMSGGLPTKKKGRETYTKVGREQK